MFNFQMKNQSQSIVELVFDDRLVSFVKEMQERFLRELILLSTHTNDIDSCMSIQENLRVYMIKNQHY